MTTALKPKAYPGVQLLAAASIEANSVEQALAGRNSALTARCTICAQNSSCGRTS
jgi:hypothetical protein